MKLIESITQDPKQSFRIVLDDGSHIDMTMIYKENQRGWFYSLVYGNIFTVNNRRLVNGPNLLRAFRNIVPFGFACLVNDGLEPVFIDDFVSGRVQLYILNQDDIAVVEVDIIPTYG